MINLHTLKSIKTAKPKRRLGRGLGSGKGRTSGRGHKGYKARAGSVARLRFEGGQMPFVLRMPKLKGFKNINRIEYKVLNVGDLAVLAKEGKITKKNLVEKGIIGKKDKLKILGDGEIKEALEVEGDAFSKSAKEKIEKAGGVVKIIEIKNKEAK